MADPVLVEAGSVKCAHGGDVVLAGTGKSKLKGGGSPAVGSVSIIGAAVGTPTPCPFMMGTVPAPCTTVVSCDSPSTALKGEGEFVVLSSSAIATTSPVAGSTFPASIVTTGQSALKG